MTTLTGGPASKPGQDEERNKPYQLSARYTGVGSEKLSKRAFQKALNLVEPGQEDIAAYHLVLPQLSLGWYVTIVGERPAQETEEKLMRLLAGGEQVMLPEETVWALDKCRKEVRRLLEAAEHRRNFELN